jgi:hypothetical protein
VNSIRFGLNVAVFVLLPVILGQVAARAVPEQLFRALQNGLIDHPPFPLSDQMCPENIL